MPAGAESSGRTDGRREARGGRGAAGGTARPGGLSAARERAVEALCDHFSRDALTVDELERRIDRAHRATALDELRELLVDLPGGEGALEPSGSTGAAVRRNQAGSDAALPTAPARRRTVLAVCGGNSRRGRWVPARRTLSVALCGGIELDFREARLAPGVTEVNALAVMGGVDIVVSPATYVESDGVAILGGFQNTDEHAVDPGPEDPVIRVRGLAVMGGVDVSVRYPGETPRDARRRRREERRSRRERIRGG